MSKGVVGQKFTFQALFVDSLGNPQYVLTPTISIFRYDEDGLKVTLLGTTALPASIPLEVGRYSYTYLIPGTFTVRDVLYGDMRGVDPVTLAVLIVEQEVDLVISSDTPSGNSGMIARFVKGG
jgi:hypothetical protein